MRGGVGGGGGGRGAGARLSPLLLFFLTLGSRSAARAYSSSTWVRGTAVLSSSSSTWRFRAAASRRSSVGRGLPSGWEGEGGRERAGGQVERARARERAAGGALPPSFLPPILALTCQGLPDQALALVLRLLLALQALAVQVLPAQAGVAAQHFFFWWERPTARRMRGGDHERGKRCGRVCVSSFLFGVRCWPEGDASDRVRVCARDGALGAVSGAPVDDSEHTSQGEQNNNPLFLTFAKKKTGAALAARAPPKERGPGLHQQHPTHTGTHISAPPPPIQSSPHAPCLRLLHLCIHTQKNVGRPRRPPGRRPRQGPGRRHHGPPVLARPGPGLGGGGGGGGRPGGGRGGGSRGRSCGRRVDPATLCCWAGGRQWAPAGGGAGGRVGAPPGGRPPPGPPGPGPGKEAWEGGGGQGGAARFPRSTHTERARFPHPFPFPLPSLCRSRPRAPRAGGRS